MELKLAYGFHSAPVTTTCCLELFNREDQEVSQVSENTLGRKGAYQEGLPHPRAITLTTCSVAFVRWKLDAQFHALTHLGLFAFPSPDLIWDSPFVINCNNSHSSSKVSEGGGRRRVSGEEEVTAYHLLRLFYSSPAALYTWACFCQPSLTLSTGQGQIQDLEMIDPRGSTSLLLVSKSIYLLLCCAND